MIYYLHEDAAECANMLDDKTLDKQIDVIVLTLDKIHHPHVNIDKKIQQYSVWASECLANYKKLVDMGLACCDEYKFRFSQGITQEQPLVKEHKLQPVIEFARDNVPDLPIHHFDIGTPAEVAINIPFTRDEIKNGKATPYPLCVPEKYYILDIEPRFREETITKCEINIIASYRNYYRAQIDLDAKFTRREKSIFLSST